MAKQKSDRPELDLDDVPVNLVDTPDKKMSPEEEAEFLAHVRENQIEAESAWSENYDAAERETRFANLGEQWDQKIMASRARAGRPCLTFNDLPQFMDQIINDLRINSPSIQVDPADDLTIDSEISNLSGTDKYAKAKVFEGLIRDIEHQSSAEAHYDTAVQHAVEGGFGWLRVFPTTANNKSMSLDLRIKSLANRWAVLMDPNADEPDMSDSDYCLVGDIMSRTAFEKLYPDAVVGDLVGMSRWWGSRETVCVAEYFERYAITRQLLQLASGEIVWADEIKDVHDHFRDTGQIVAERSVDTYKIRWFKLTGSSILRGPVDMPCSTIPVVPVLGKSTNVHGKKDFRGVIRHAMDPKRAENFWMTNATERVAMAPKAPWVATATMVEGYEREYQEAATGNPAVMLYNPDPMAPGQRPQREQAALMPVAELQMAASMTDKVKSTIGMYSASLGARSNETSGKAIMARQRESDVANFTFSDNLSRAIRRVGRLLVEMIPEIYCDQRCVRLRQEDGTGDWVEINMPSDGGISPSDLSIGSFDVVVKSGPSYTTQRAEAAEALMEFMRVAPSVGALIVDKVASAMDWPGADGISKRLMHTIPEEMLTEDELKLRGEKAPPAPTPEQQAQMAESEADMAMAQAKMAEAQARLAEAEMGGDAAVMVETVRDAVAEGIAEIMVGRNENG